MTPTEREALLARTEKATTTSQITTRGTTILPTVDVIALLTLARKAKALERALRFYRDEAWTLAQDGDEQTGQVTDQWLEPSSALTNDQGGRARAALGDTLT
jgi:hypothetical protein